MVKEGSRTGSCDEIKLEINHGAKLYRMTGG